MDPAWIERDIRVIEKSEPVAKALGFFQQESRTFPLVADKRRVYGVIDGRRMVARGLNPETRAAKVAQPVPCLTQDASTESVLRAFDAVLTPRLPVVTGPQRRAVGYIDAISALAGLEFPDGNVSCDGKAWIPDNGTIEDAVQAFQAYDVPSLPVIDGFARVQGTVMRSDLVRLGQLDAHRVGRRDVSGRQTDIRHQSVRGFMEDGPPLIDNRAEPDELRSLLSKHGVAFVQRGGRYEGMIDAPRLIRWARGSARVPVTPQPTMRATYA